jgi:serine/threonine protein kinase
MEHAAQERYGRYEVIEALADGAMGSIYLASDPNSGGIVAIKTLKPGSAPDGSAKEWEAILREAQVAQLLSHPNIVTVHEVVAGEGGDPPFVVMEYVHGTSLSALLTAGMPLPMDFALPVTSQVAAALDHAHLKGVVHGDIKPGNILISDDETARLIDFGIAHLADDGSEGPDRPAMGTPRYTATEQAQGKEIGRRADVFSLGVVAYEMLTGLPAFSGENSAEVTWKIARGMMDRLPSEIDELSPQVQSVLAQALHVDPIGRFASAGEFASALLGAADPVAQAQPRPEPRFEPGPDVARQQLDQVSTQDLSELAPAAEPAAVLPEVESDSEILDRSGEDVLSLPNLDSTSASVVPSTAESEIEGEPLPENGTFGAPDQSRNWQELLRKLPSMLDRFQLDLEWRRTALIAGATLVSALILGLLTIWLAHPGDFDNLGSSAEHRLRQRVVPLLKEGHRLLQEGEPAVAARVFSRAEDIAPHLEGVTAQRKQAEREVLLQEQKQLDEEEFAALFEEGTRALRVGRFDKATQVAQRLLEIDPESPDALELAHRIKNSRADARRRTQNAESREAAETESTASSPQAVEPIRAAAVRPGTTSASGPSAAESLPDWSRLKVDLFSYLPKGIVTVYADDDQILLQPFRFTEKGRLFLKKGTAGRLEAEQRLSAGDTEFRIYVSSEGKETQIVNLPVSLEGGETHVLRIIVAENGSTSAQLD